MATDCNDILILGDSCSSQLTGSGTTSFFDLIDTPTATEGINNQGYFLEVGNDGSGNPTLILVENTGSSVPDGDADGQSLIWDNTAGEWQTAQYANGLGFSLAGSNTVEFVGGNITINNMDLSSSFNYNVTAQASAGINLTSSSSGNITLKTFGGTNVNNKLIVDLVDGGGVSTTGTTGQALVSDGIGGVQWGGAGIDVPDGTAEDDIIVWNNTTMEWEVDAYPTIPTYTAGQGIDISVSDVISFDGGTIDLTTNGLNLHSGAAGSIILIKNKLTSQAEIELDPDQSTIAIKTGSSVGAAGEILKSNGGGRVVWDKASNAIDTDDIPIILPGNPELIIVDDGVGGLGKKGNDDIITDGLDQLYGDVIPTPGAGDLYVPMTDDTGTQLIELDTEIANHPDVTANTADRHDALTLGGVALDTTDDTLDLTGQVLTVNLATGTTDGAMSAADFSKLSGIEANAKDDQNASEVPFTPTADVTSSDTQAAIEEVYDFAQEIEYSYRFIQNETLFEDLLIESIQIDSVSKTAGVNTVELSVNGGAYFDLIAAVPYTVPASANTILRITYNGGFNNGVVAIKGIKL